MKDKGKMPRFEPVETAVLPSRDDLLSLHQHEGNSGAGEVPKQKVDQDFQRLESATELSRSEMSKIQPPKWVYARIMRGTVDADLIELLMRRMRRVPNHEMHLLAEMLLNDIGRKPEGGRLIHQMLDQRIAYELQSVQEKELDDSLDDEETGD